MKLKLFLLIMLVAMLPLLVLAQDEKSEPDLNKFVAELNAKCPIDFADGWQVNSFVNSEDAVSVIITVAPSVEAYIPYMAANADQMKQMWLQQMQQYGQMWNSLIDLVVDNNKNFVITLKAPSSDAQAQFVFVPADFKKPA